MEESAAPPCEAATWEGDPRLLGAGNANHSNGPNETKTEAEYRLTSRCVPPTAEPRMSSEFQGRKEELLSNERSRRNC